MIYEPQYSDQFNNWSDRKWDYGSLSGIAAPTEKNAHSETQTGKLCHSAWFGYRAFQALRKPSLQVCGGQGAWTKVLSFREQTGGTTRNGLRTPGPLSQCDGLSGEFPGIAAEPRRALRNRSRTRAPQGATIERETRYSACYDNYPFDSDFGQYPSCQHDPEFFGMSKQLGGRP